MAMLSDKNKDFLGRGIAFPLRLDARGELCLVEYETDIQEAIRIILDTTPGERVMRPDFGVGLRSLLFEPMNSATISLVCHRVEQALTLWEPRIRVEEVKVHADQNGRNGRLDIHIRYRVRDTNTFYNLVYPFYLREGEPS
jgi:phage baseplate assembly protein W